MNIIEAIDKLNTGRCIGIKNKTLYGDRVYKLNGGGIFSFEDSAVFMGWETILSEDWELVGEVKQYEEVEVVKMYSESTGKTYPCWVEGIPADAIKLSGTIKREVKPKKKVLTEVGSTANRGSFVKSGLPSGTRLYAYLEEE